MSQTCQSCPVVQVCDCFHRSKKTNQRFDAQSTHKYGRRREAEKPKQIFCTFLINAAGFVTLDALVAKTGAGSKKSVVTRLTEMETILGRSFNKVTVATGAAKGASQVAYSI